MMKKLGYIKNIIAAVVVTTLLIGCSEDAMDKINAVDNNPTDVMAKATATELLMNSSFSIAGGDISLYSTVYVEHEVGVYNQFFNAETRVNEPTSSATMGNSWNSIYYNIKYAKLIIKKCSEGGPEEGSNITLGIAKTMLAYNGAMLTDMFGDAPFSEAGELTDAGLPLYRQPKVDKQEDIYKEVFALLDEAISLFDKADEGPYGNIGSYDLIYSGKGALWKKAAYALKARYTMRLLNTYADKNAELKKVLEYVGKSFTSASEEFKFNLYDGTSQINPFYGVTTARSPFGISQSLVDKLVERNDPRFSQMFIAKRPTATQKQTPVVNLDELKDKIAPNGEPTQDTGIYALMISDYSYDAATHLMSYHELLFLKAEAEARLGQDSEATLKAAIAAAFKNHAISVESAFNEGAISSLPVNHGLVEADAEKYFDENLKPLFTVNPVKEIMNQKYLALVGANGESIEIYNDYRRLKALKEDYIKMNNSKKFPLRFVYGTSDATSNPNVEKLVGDGSYVYTENVWWAGGTR